MTDVSLKNTITTDLKAAMKQRDELVTGTLRMVLTAIKNEEVSGKEAKELSDAEVLKILAKENKKRHQSSEEYRKHNRVDLAEREEAESAIIDKYLPAQLTGDELAAIVTRVIGETGASGMAHMGVVIKNVQTHTAGRAEGGAIAAEVKRQLGA